MVEFGMIISFLFNFQVYRQRLDGCTIRPSKLAVQGINLTIPQSECFGLLGVNGRYLYIVLYSCTS